MGCKAAHAGVVLEGVRYFWVAQVYMRPLLDIALYRA